MAEKILVVEDELVLRETLTYNLRKQGYEVDAVADGNQAVEITQEDPPDLILLDVMLPGIDGFEVCRILRQDLNVPIIMLTARDDEVDKVVGLEVGADDYLTKPFSMRELLARVKAQLRRIRLLREEFASEAEEASDELLRFDNLKLDLERREVTLDGELLALKPKEYDLLVYLAQHEGRVLSRDQLLEEVWGWDYTGGSRTVDVHIRWLREKIESEPANPTRIVTLRGAGYRFEG
ncbi:MAG: response regulator [Anaerolineae bacterium]